MAQDAVAELERSKGEVETVIASKEKNNQLPSDKLDELQGGVESAEEELEDEQQAPA